MDITKLKNEEEYIEWIYDQAKDLTGNECLVIDPKPSGRIIKKLEAKGLVTTIDFITSRFAFRKAKESESCPK